MDVTPAHIPKALGNTIYCGACGEPATTVDSVDPFVICFACTSGHKFFVYPDYPLAIETAKAKSMVCPDFKEDPEAAARYWLSDPAARCVLNPQIATLFRSFLEGFGPNPELEFEYCPRCGQLLSDFEQDDIWVVGRACSNHHNWAYRGGHLGCVIEGNQFGLHREYSQENARTTAAWWLGSNKKPQSNVHPSMRSILETIA
jgi:hypothetical protein